MKWVIAELVIEPGMVQENDEGEQVPYSHWIRHEDVGHEFSTRQVAQDWIAQQSNRLLDDGTTERFQARRLEDGTAPLEG